MVKIAPRRRPPYHGAMGNQKKWVSTVIWIVVVGMVLSLVGLGFAALGS